MRFKRNQNLPGTRFFPAVLLGTGLLFSCNKIDIAFEENDRLNDPNISYFDNYQVDVATYKTDSFTTSGSNVFVLGSHFDTSFSKLWSEAYAEVSIPTTNTVKDKDVLFDSLVMVLTPTGNYYGDTTLPLKLSVFKLDENIENEDEDDNNYYYPRSFSKSGTPIGQATFTNIKPNRKKELTIRLPDQMGEDLLRMLKRDRDTIQTQDEFRKYLKGLCIVPDSTFSNTIYFFGTDTSSSLLRLHYKERGTVTTEKKIGFGSLAQKQFNHFVFNRTNTPFAIFHPYKPQVKSSSLMSNKAYLSNNIPTYIKLTFPALQSLKEQYPFVRVVKAELEIKPTPGSYRYPYTLPSNLRIQVSTRDNNFDGGILMDASGLAEQTGNLVIDDLYGQNTRYTFEITSFINTVLEEGRYSTMSLFLTLTSNSYFTSTERLVINDQQSKDGIKLKLYVLGL